MNFTPSNPNVVISNNHTSKPSFFQKIRAPFSNLSGSKKPVSIAVVVLMVFALTLGIYLVRKPTQLAPKASTEGVSISLKPATVNTNTNQEFQVDVFVDTGTSNMQITAVQAKINYDPALLELKNAAIKEFLPVLLEPQNSSGNTRFASGIPLGGTPKTGSGVVATLTFKALSSTSTTQITFDNSGTIVAASGQTASVAKDFTPTTVSFGTSVSPNPSPSASPSPISTTPETSFTLEGTTTTQTNQEFTVKVFSRSDIDNANLWNATINFPKNLVEVVRIDKAGSFITNWSEEYFNNQSGEISLTGGVISPGLKTDLNNSLMATIVFKTKASGTANINLVDPSAIYKNSDNSKMNPVKRNAAVTILHGDHNLNKGDGNNDGKIDLQDLSVMYSKWSPATDITAVFQLDFNDDKRINSIDYTQLVSLLTNLGVIRN